MAKRKGLSGKVVQAGRGGTAAGQTRRAVELEVGSGVGMDGFGVQQVAGMFGLNVEAARRVKLEYELPSVDGYGGWGGCAGEDGVRPWLVGLIVGPSGSGKSSVARDAHMKGVWAGISDWVEPGAMWPNDAAMVEGFTDAEIKEVTAMLTSVGLSSPPAWVRPYRVLSGGEKFRADLARALIMAKQRLAGWAEPRANLDRVVIFDEFTSVVDRLVARVGSAAVAKAVRRMGREDEDFAAAEGLPRPERVRFVAVTCHYDVVEWLKPDWVLEMPAGRLRWMSDAARPVYAADGKKLGVVQSMDKGALFAGEEKFLRAETGADDASRGWVRGWRDNAARRIELEVHRCEPAVGKRLWATIGRHHYLDLSLHPAAQCYAAVVKQMGEEVVGGEQGGVVVGIVAVLPMMGRVGRDSVSRVVVLPDWQGVGVGRSLLRMVGEDRVSMGRRLNLVTSHPGMIGALNRKDNGWVCVDVTKGGSHRRPADPKKKMGRQGLSCGRAVVSFEWRGGTGNQEKRSGIYE